MSHITSVSIDVDIGMTVCHKTVIDTIRFGKVTKFSASQDLRSSIPGTVVYDIEEQVMSEEDSK